MTTTNQIQSTLSYISVEAYLAGIDDGAPLYFISGNKVQGNSPRIEKKDGTVPSYLPTLNLKDSNTTVLTKLDVVCNVFFAFRMARQEKGKK